MQDLQLVRKTIYGLMRSCPRLSTGYGKRGIGPNGMAKDCEARGSQAVPEDSISEDRIRDERDVTGAVNEIGSGSGKIVVAATVAGMLRHTNDEAGLRKVLSKIAIRPGRPTAAMRDDNER